MKKRVLSMLLALVMTFGLCVPVFAAGDEFEAEPAAPVEAPAAPTEAVPAEEPMPVAAKPADEPEAAAVTEVASGTCGAQGENVKWTLTDDGTLTIYGTGAMRDYEYDYYYGDCESRPWEDYIWTDIKRIIIQDGVTSIGSWAFTYCESLTSVTASGNVTSIGDYAFYDCVSLTSVTIPDSVTSIGEYAFAVCISLTSVTIPGSVTSVGEAAFRECDSLMDLTICDGVTSIGSWAFTYCESLTSITIPGSMTNIENFTFYGCFGLTSVTIPDGVTSIGREAFHYCDNLRDVYYGGTQQQWRAITVGENNGPLTSAAIHYNGTGPAEPTPTPGLDDIQPPAGGTGWRYVPETGDYYYFKNYKRVGDYWVGFSDGASKWANNWYYADADGKLLTGLQYLDDLKGGKAWFMLQTTNDRGEIGKMLTGWQWTYTDAGTGYFNPNYGSQGMCTYTSAWGGYNAATGLWGDGQLHMGTISTTITAQRALELADAFSAFSDGETQWINGEKFVIQFWDCGQLERNGRTVFVFQVRRLRAIEGPQMTQLMETIYVDAETGTCSYY